MDRNLEKDKADEGDSVYKTISPRNLCNTARTYHRISHTI